MCHKLSMEQQSESRSIFIFGMAYDYGTKIQQLENLPSKISGLYKLSKNK